jgi:hypothetical protein
MPQYWDQTCKGIGIVLETLPILTAKAAQFSFFLFLIYWSRPCLLEEFLVSLFQVVSLTVPEWLFQN